MTSSDREMAGRSLRLSLLSCECCGSHGGGGVLCQPTGDHQLGFGEEELIETVTTTKDVGSSMLELDLKDEADTPAVPELPRSLSRPARSVSDREVDVGRMAHVSAASGHPSDCLSIPNFRRIDCTASTRPRLNQLPPSDTSSHPPCASLEFIEVQ